MNIKKGLQKCPRCGIIKSVGEFSKNRSAKNGYGCYCKICLGEMRKELALKNPGWWKRYYWEHRDKRLKQAKERRQQNLEKIKLGNRLSQWKNKYKINLKATIFDDKAKEQNNRCAICGRHQSEFKRSFHLDHNHKTKQIRGLLCQHCNFLVGHLEKASIKVKKAEEYLSFWNNKAGTKTG